MKVLIDGKEMEAELVINIKAGNAPKPADDPPPAGGGGGDPPPPPPHDH